MILKKHLILPDTDQHLRKQAIDLDVDHISTNDQELIDQMVLYIDICFKNEADKYGITPGIAIAGNQVGLLKKVIYLHFMNDNQEVKYLLANPKITAYSYVMVYLQTGEGCLSVNDDHNGYVPRYARIIVDAYDLINHKPITIDASGYLAICLQHEIDHLSGILFYDHINKDNPYATKKE